MIPLFKVFSSPQVIPELKKVFDSGMIGQAEKNEEFESVLSNYFNEEYINTTNAATSAEHLTYHLLKKYGLNEGNEVLVTALSCLATHVAITLNGFKIKFVDVDPRTLNVDLEDLERKLTPSTKAINLVHWGGSPNNLEKVEQLQRKAFAAFGFKPWVIEDCAHSLGAKYKNKLIGTHGNICTFSLQAIKLINAGDGGFVISPNHKDFYRRFRLQRWFGLNRDNKNQKDMRCLQDCEEEGFKFHMNDINSVIGIENFRYLDILLQGHKDNAAFYDQELKGIPGITLLERDKNSEPSFWIYSMLVEDKENFMKAMKDRRIETSMVHDRVDKHSCYKQYRTFLPNLDYVIPRLINIPVHWGVSSEDREHVISSIKKGW